MNSQQPLKMTLPPTKSAPDSTRSQRKKTLPHSPLKTPHSARNFPFPRMTSCQLPASHRFCTPRPQLHTTDQGHSPHLRRSAERSLVSLPTRPMSPRPPSFSGSSPAPACILRNRRRATLLLTTSDRNAGQRRTCDLQPHRPRCRPPQGSGAPCQASQERPIPTPQ